MIDSIKCIVFDLDGTLIDSLGDITNSINAALTEYKLPNLNSNDVMQYVGPSLDALLKFATKDSKVSTEEIREAYRIHYLNSITHQTCLFPGIDQLLDKLQKTDKTLAILTNKLASSAKTILSRLNYKDIFSQIVGPDTFDVLKPDPRGMQKLLKSINCSTDESIMIGDTIYDIQCAHNANMRSIAVGYGYNTDIQLKKENPSYFAKTVDDLTHLIFNHVNLNA